MRRASGLAALALVVALASASCASTDTRQAEPLQPLPALSVDSYLGTWYQVAWFPNWFQRACVSDTSSRYGREADLITVRNVCRRDGGRPDEIRGIARPVGQLRDGQLVPATLEVSFLPGWLQWLPLGWGSYWVIQYADDGRYAVVSEPSRRFLWVLARSPSLSTTDETEIRSRLQAQGFDVTRWQSHPHTTPVP